MVLFVKLIERFSERRFPTDQTFLIEVLELSLLLGAVLHLLCRAYSLGIALGACTVKITTATSVLDCQLYLYIFSLALFHFGEFLFAAVFHWNTVSIYVISPAFLLHNPAYNAVLAVSIVEYFCEIMFFPAIKQNLLCTCIGIALVVGGFALRTCALWTAQSNFSHDIAKEKKKEHKFVSSGIYAFIRHPGYCGWFFMSIGTQLMVVNPVSFLLFVGINWIFFAVRIYDEEQLLKSFFGNDYVRYSTTVWSGIPLYGVLPVHTYVSPSIRQLMTR